MTSKTIFVRLLSFFTLTVAWYFSVLIVAIPLSVWHLVHFKAYEFIMLGVLIDMYFMPLRWFPLYTICFTGAFIIMEIIKPRFKTRVTTL